jgi:hypothetical protein
MGVCFLSFYTGGTHLPASVWQIIDGAVAADFRVQPVGGDDQGNSMYKAIRQLFDETATQLLYERVVLSDQAPVIPAKQYLFGLRSNMGLCMLTSHPGHKHVLCDDRVESPHMCGLKFLLVEADTGKVWAYAPLCPFLVDCAQEGANLEMRRSLFMAGV